MDRTHKLNSCVWETRQQKHVFCAVQFCMHRALNSGWIYRMGRKKLTIHGPIKRPMNASGGGGGRGGAVVFNLKCIVPLIRIEWRLRRGADQRQWHSIGVASQKPRRRRPRLAIAVLSSQYCAFKNFVNTSTTLSERLRVSPVLTNNVSKCKTYFLILQTKLSFFYKKELYLSKRKAVLSNRRQFFPILNIVGNALI